MNARILRCKMRRSNLTLALVGGMIVHGTALAQTPPSTEVTQTPSPAPEVTPQPFQEEATAAPVDPSSGKLEEAPAALKPSPLQQAPKGPTASEPAAPDLANAKQTETPWYEKIKLRGYTQFRYNRLPSFNPNDDLVNAQGDRTVGEGNGFSIRRARIIIYGDLHERVSIYFQPDFASTIGDQLHVTILRDWYADLFLDKAKEFRFRVGQSKVPFGFENLQSSQNRLPLDRNDALNSAVKDERDIGVFFYWAPEEIRARFKYLVDSGLKGSGDYGVVGFGVYNGQTANRPALADDMHVIGRVTYPFKFGEQYVEFGGGGYYGKFYTQIDDSGTYTLEKGKIKDARVHASVVVYPQPFGFVAEGNYGVGPSQGDTAATVNVIEDRQLFGGYAQVMYKIDHVLGTVSLIPFARATYYDGGRKFETNAPRYEVKELELGVEWQLIKNLEFVLAYDLASRTSNLQEEKGHVTRVQLQVNY